MINELIPVNDFQTAVPSEDGLLTVRTLDTESVSNNDLLNTYELITVEDLPESLHTEGTCFSELENLTLITTKEELFIYLCEVLIRFDADPDHYQKSDYEALIRLLVRTLIHLYENEISPEGFLSFAPVLGIATTTTDPLALMLQNNHRYPALFMAETAGVYTNFGITVTTDDLRDSVVWLIPNIVNSTFTSYRKEVYTMTLSALTQIQADWNQTDTNALDYIKNKPSLYVDNTRTQLIYGTVIWLHDLVFRVTPCAYYILGQYYTSPQTDITLTSSDLTNPRLDVIWVDTNGAAGFSTGIPSADPAKPIVNTSIQLELTSILIAANATTPSQITDTIIYDENTEWTFTNLVAGVTTFDLNSSSDTFSGSKALKITPTVPSTDLDARFKFTGASTSFVGGNLVFYIKTTGLAPTNEFIISVSDGINSSYVWITQSNTFGLSFNSTSWQQVVIPSSAFSVGISPINSVEIKLGVTSLTNSEVLFDKIYIQSGLTVGTTYDHPSYIPVNLSTTGNTVISGIVTDTIGSVVSVQTRELAQIWKRTGALVETTTSNDRLKISSTTTPAIFANVDVSTNTVGTAVSLERSIVGASAAGIGIATDYTITEGNGVAAQAGLQICKLTDVTVGAIKAQFEWHLKYNATVEKRMELIPTGLNIISPTEDLAITTAELNVLPNGWSFTGGVTASGGGVYTFGSPGTARTLFYDFGPVTIGDIYVLVFGITGSAPGVDRFPTITFGGVTRTETSYGMTANWHYDISPTTTSGVLTFSVPSSNTLNTYTIHSISLKRITAASLAILTNTVGSNVSNQFKASYSNNSISIGVNAGKYLVATNALIAGGIHNVAFGNDALQRATISNYCVAIGNLSQYSNTEASYNVSVGYGTLASNKVSAGSVAIGHHAANAATGRGITAVGYHAFRLLTTGEFTVALGYLAGQSLTSASNNVILGANAATTAVSLSQSIVIGSYALNNSNTGTGIVTIGYNTLPSHASGNYITAIGASSGLSINGSYSTLIGAFAGGGSNNGSLYEIVQYYANYTDEKATLIGMNAGKNVMTNIGISDYIAIGYDTKVYKSNQAVFGNNSTTSTYLKGVVEIRDFSILNTEVLADPTFPAASTKWDVTGDFALSASGMTYTYGGGIGTFKQTLANQAFQSKKRRWYKFTYAASGSLAVPGPGTSTFVLTMTGSTFAPVTLTLIGGNTTGYAYIYSIDTPTDISFSMTCTLGAGNGILNFTSMSLKECIGGDLFVNRDIEQTRGGYQYHSQYREMDTAGDWRTFANSTAFYTEYCTVGGATKGSGTWVVKQTITI